MLIPSKEILFDYSKPYNGVFYYFQTYTGITDIYASKYINASISKRNSGDVQTPLIDKSEADTYCCTPSNDPSPWYEVDFMENRFSLKKYTYRAQTYDFFKEWYLYGYNRIGEPYKIVHHIQNHVNKNMTNFFDSTNSGYYRYFRLVPIGKRFNDDTTLLSIHRLEFFGKFINAVELNSNRYCSHHYSHASLSKTTIAFVLLLCY